jgi:hypothetical protein
MLFVLILLLAHGWYEPDCCADEHCHPVPCSELYYRADGFIFWHNYRFWPDTPLTHIKNPRPSKDGQCHVCVVADTGICVYVPKVTS